jgi:hypothetical protein
MHMAKNLWKGLAKDTRGGFIIRLLMLASLGAAGIGAGTDNQFSRGLNDFLSSAKSSGGITEGIVGVVQGSLDSFRHVVESLGSK